MSTLYVTDLDGTLMRDDKIVSDYTVQVLNHLIEKGVCITYATARSIVSSSEIVRDAHFSIPVITKNGAEKKKMLLRQVQLKRKKVLWM